MQDVLADLRPVPRGVDEVRATRLADGLHGLRLPLPYLATRSVNAYLLETADGFCLVDCGTSLEPGWDALEHALKLAGARPEDIEVLVLTHLHADHAGLAATVVERTGCALWRAPGPQTLDDLLRDPITPLEARRAAGLREGIPPDELDRWVDSHLAEDVNHARIEPDRLVAPGDVLYTRAGEFEVVPAGGHSPTQIALVGPRLAMTADLAYEIPEPFLEWGWTLDPYAEHLAALDRVAAYRPEVLLPGHGRPVPGAVERLRGAKRAAQALVPSIRVALAGGPRSAYELTIERIPNPLENNRRQSLMAIVLAVLEHLERRGTVTARVGDDGVRRFM